MNPLLGPFPRPHETESTWVRYLIVPLWGLWVMAEYDRYAREHSDEEADEDS